MLKNLTALAVILLLAACGMADPFTQAKIDARRAAARQTHEMAESPEAVQAFLANTTTKVWNRTHGTQIEYLAANGSSYLWYPGNGRVLPGRWHLQMERYGLEICFAYGPLSMNPATGQRGGSECDMAAYYLLNRDEIVAGDPLGLARRIPFVMPEAVNMSITQAMAKAGMGPLGAANKAMAPQYPPDS